MNRARLLLSLVAFGACASSLLANGDTDAKSAARPNAPLTPRFVQVRDRIDALFRHRNEAPPAPDPRFNPFRPPGSAPAANVPVPAAAPAAREPAADPAPADLAVLQQAVATLKVNGIFEVAGQFHLVLNARPYKNGDIVQTHVQGQPVYLRVREISRHSVSLVLNDTEMTMRF